MTDVVIVGGGLSGLAAAITLVRNGARITLIERSQKLGGRCYSYRDRTTGDTIDNGQHVLLGAYHETLRYLSLIGTRDALHSRRDLILPIVDPERGRGVFRVPRLPRPLHLTVGMLKFRLLTLRERREVLRVGAVLSRWNSAVEEALADRTIDRWLTELGQSDPVKRIIWYPIAVSMMNELPDRASALLFGRSLRKTFFGRASDAAMLIPTIGQTELYVDGAFRMILANGSSVLLNEEVSSISTAGTTVNGIRLRRGHLVKTRAVISAVPQEAYPRLVPSNLRHLCGITDLHPWRTSPIVSVYLWFDREVMEGDFVGLTKGTAQWIFNRGAFMREERGPWHCLAAVISGAHEVVHLPQREIVKRVVRDIAAICPYARDAVLHHTVVIKEKRATFSPTPGTEAMRPPAESALKNLYLAGDWTQTGYPATIEGAVLSGFRAAELASR